MSCISALQKDPYRNNDATDGIGEQHEPTRSPVNSALIIPGLQPSQLTVCTASAVTITDRCGMLSAIHRRPVAALRVVLREGYDLLEDSNILGRQCCFIWGEARGTGGFWNKEPS
jgi:hypothetical protein